MRGFRQLSAILLASSILSSGVHAQELPGPFLRIGPGSITAANELPPDNGSNNGPLTIGVDPAFPTSVTLGDTYGGNLTVYGGTPGYNLTLAGQLPIGVTKQAPVDNVHALSGVFSQIGDYLFSYSATDQNAGNASFGPIEVDVDAPLSYDAATVSLRRTVSRSESPVISGGETESPYSFNLLTAPATLPVGMLYGANGVLSGVPSALGSGQFSARATDADGRHDDAIISWSVTEALAITVPPSDIAATINQPYTGNGISVGNSLGAISWVLHSGSLPEGMTLNSGSGAISGTPTSGGSFENIILLGTDAGDGSTILAPAFSIDVSTIVPATITGGTTYGVNYPVEVGGVFPNPTGSVTWTSSSLPSGLSLNSSTGVISGSSSSVVSPTITLTGTDSTGKVAEVQFVLTITTVIQPTILTGLPYSTSTTSIGANTSSWSSLQPGDMILAAVHQAGNGGAIAVPSGMRALTSYAGGGTADETVMLMFHHYQGGAKPFFTFATPPSSHQGVAMWIVKNVRPYTMTAYQPAITGVVQNLGQTQINTGTTTLPSVTTDTNALYIAVAARGNYASSGNFSWTDPTDAFQGENMLLDAGALLGNGGGMSVFVGAIRTPGTFTGPTVSHNVGTQSVRFLWATIHPPAPGQ